ncbi:MAG: DUF445 family protein [Sumerlaeia bacterium]
MSEPERIEDPKETESAAPRPFTEELMEESKVPSGAIDAMVGLSAVLSIAAFAGLAYLVLAKMLPPGTLPEPNQGWRAALLVLVSAGIGFSTNWLAIKMLFRPRERKQWLVLWPQGLLPREQERFARALGKVAAQRLLSPEAVASGLADESLRGPLGRVFRDELRTLLEQPAVRSALTDYAEDVLRTKGPRLIQRLRPELRSALEGALEKHLTPERLLAITERAVMAFARNRPMRRSLARWIGEQTAREGVIQRIVGTLQEQFMRYREKYPVRGFIAEQFVIDWDQVRTSIVNILKSREASEELAEIMVDVAGSLVETLRQPKAARATATFRRQFIDNALDWFETEGVEWIAAQAADLADKDETWRLVDRVVEDFATRIPQSLFESVGDGSRLRPEVQEHLRVLQRRLVKATPIAGIVEKQVLAMEPRKIEALVDEIGRRELATIQVLGLVVGALAGAALIVLI